MIFDLKLQLFGEDYSNRVINGSWGEVYLDGEFVREATSCKAVISMKYADVQMCGQLGVGKKLTGTEKTGSINMNKVCSRMALKLSDMIKQGKTPSFTIVSKLDDPDAWGAERIVLKGCKFTDLTLADWTSGNVGTFTQSFTFDDWELMDTIEVQ